MVIPGYPTGSRRLKSRAITRPDGDCIFPQTRPETAYTVEWFGRDDGRGGRNVKLNDVDRPLPIIVRNALIPGIRIVSSASRDTLVIGETRIAPDLMIRLDADPWKEQVGYYQIRNVRRDRNGRITADTRSIKGLILGDATGWSAGIAPVQAEAPNQDNISSLQEVRENGRTFRISGRVLVVERQDDNKTPTDLRTHHIRGFFQANDGLRMRECFTQEQGKGVRYFLCDRELLNKQYVVLWDEYQHQAPQEHRLANDDTLYVGQALRHGRDRLVIRELLRINLPDSCLLYIRYDDTRWTLCSSDGRTLNPGWIILPHVRENGNACTAYGWNYRAGAYFYLVSQRKYVQSIGFREQEDGTIFIRLNGNEEVVLFRADGVRDSECQPAVFKCTWEHAATPVILCTKQAWRLRGQGAQWPKGHRFTVSHIVPPMLNMWPRAVFSNGYTIELTPQNASFFEIEHNGAWIPLGPHAVAIGTDPPLVSFQNIKSRSQT